MRLLFISAVFCLMSGCSMIGDRSNEPVTIDRDSTRNEIACMDNDVNKRCIDPVTPLTY